MLNYRDYIDFAERYLRLAQDRHISEDINWLLIPAVILSWTALESFVNNRLNDYGSLPEEIFELHERALLLEQKVQFRTTGDKAGTFVLAGTEYRRLEDKILFLISKFGRKSVGGIKSGSLWQQFQEFKKARDSIVHPRLGKEVVLSIQDVQKYLETSKNLIQMLSEHLWGHRVEF